MASHYAYKKELRATIKEEETNRHLRKSHLDQLADAYEAHGDKNDSSDRPEN